MLTNYRRRSRAGAVTPFRGRVVAGAAMRTARTLVEAAQKLAPYARKAGAKSTIQRKLGGFRVAPKKSIRVATKAHVSSDYASGNDYSKVTHTLGRRKKTTLSGVNQLVRKTMSTGEYRFQRLTQFDTNVGAIALAQQLNTVNNNLYLPLHIYDLSSFNNTSVHAPAKWFGWTDTTSAANVVSGTIASTNADGSPNATGGWVFSSRDGTTFPDASVMLHQWSDIRLLFYGARKRATKFRVTFFRCKDETANPFHAADSNTDLKQLVEWFTRPNIYNTIQTYETKIAKKLRIVKQYDYLIPACQTTDVDTSVGKVKEVRIFMPHDKVYKLDWLSSSEASLNHTLEDGQDFVRDDLNQNMPWHSSRMFMAITALSPERRSIQDVPGGSQLADAASEPSYDILIRNKIMTP